MRPLVHPAVAAVTVEAILHALSDPVRAALFAAIVDADAATSCSRLVTVAGRTVAKSSLSQHLKVLRDAGLIHGERRGVEVLNTSRAAEIDDRFPGLIAAILAAHRAQTRGTPATRGRAATARRHRQQPRLRVNRRRRKR
ncbi:MAG TPA: helix-turn-helix domain-containing protein [Vicinamibacterales bacterium]|nr:helix-turn-helix domain-containing protein [Vicinamibacterales bacterium]